MQKPTSAADASRGGGSPVRVVIVTLDHHLASATERARETLAAEMPGLEISLHAAATFSSDPAALERCTADIANGDIIIANMLFMEDHIRAVLPALEARRDHCDAMVCCMAAGEVIKLTRLGRFSMSGEARGIVALLKRLRGSAGKKANGQPQSSGAKQMAMLRRLPKLLKFIPGTAQDVRAYFLTLQYWLAGSEDNIANMIRLLVGRYATGERSGLRQSVRRAPPPVEYPEVGVYHPDLATPITDDPGLLPKPSAAERKGTVGVLILRSYALAGNARHYDGVIRALEAKGLAVIPAFASGLDARPAIDKYFVNTDGSTKIDALVSLTGFSLVGGPAYNDADAADTVLSRLDVPYIAAQAIEFQSLEGWQASERGLTPVEATLMVAIPELDGATGPMLFGGRVEGAGRTCAGCDRSCRFEHSKTRDMEACAERIDQLAGRVARLVELRRSARKARKLAITLFNFPPNAGATGTAAFLSVFASLHNTLRALREAGYDCDVPETVDDLRTAILEGNAKDYGANANVHARVSAEDIVRGEPHVADIEAQWGPAPGRQQSDGRSVLVLGRQFGNVLVGIQPAFGYEGDPMRLLFEKGFAPTHAFAAFYRYLREDFGAHAVLHFGTHGALEFMPGKQTGLSGKCWPDRLIGDLPNYYLYAANNPSEGTIAKRRAAATLISHLTPPVTSAGLYRGLIDVKSSIERWRALLPDETREREQLAPLIQAQAAELDLAAAEPAWLPSETDAKVSALWSAILELEYTLIPQGLHIVGATPTREERIDLLAAMNEAGDGPKVSRDAIIAMVDGSEPHEIVAREGAAEDQALATTLAEIARVDYLLRQETELPALIHALDGGFVKPAPSGDLLRTPDILPTGRNAHGFDPFRMPSAFAVKDGAEQANRLVARHLADTGDLPATVALVLWGTDNLKSEGAQIAQALALMGAKPRFDSYGRLCGAELIPLADLGRPRIDVVVTLSGIFRDLLPLQTRVLAEAAYLAATAEGEPLDGNFIRAHALAYQREHNCDIEAAALRVFSNAEGAYGANVNNLIESGAWEDEDELAETYSCRKGYAYARTGTPTRRPELLRSMMADVSLAYQNLESVELGVTTIDHYFDTLGGISRSARRAGGKDIAVYIGDQTRGSGTVRTLNEQIALETRTRTLNPKWYEGMLSHGYEGVRQIESQVTNTMGWSATTGQVDPWVYRQITQTYVLDPEMRRRLAELNPTASARVANRLIEAHERNYWQPDDDMLAALREAGEELEDRLEGIEVEVAA